MESKKYNIVMGDKEKAEIIIREVNTANELPIKPPRKINISGTIGAPLEFLLKRMPDPKQINKKLCHIKVDREQLKIWLHTNEDDEYTHGTIEGCLEYHPKYVAFGINSGKVWTPSELGMFFKMNRFFFLTKEDNMKLVTDLMNFKATVDNKIERSLKESGDRTDNFAQVVNSNLPKAFAIEIPIFKGRPPEQIEVETFASINGREVNFILLSPGAQQLIEEIRDKVIDEQLTKIREIAPEIAIIES